MIFSISLTYKQSRKSHFQKHGIKILHTCFIDKFLYNFKIQMTVFMDVKSILSTNKNYKAYIW